MWRQRMLNDFSPLVSAVASILAIGWVVVLIILSGNRWFHARTALSTSRINGEYLRGLWVQVIQKTSVPEMLWREC